MTDIVVPLGAWATDEDLRFALRSWETNVSHDRVWIVGASPKWLSDAAGFIPTHQGNNRWRNTSDNLLAAIEDDRISDPFVLANDDMFALRHWPRMDWNRGPLNEHLINDRRALPYRNGALHALQVLGELGIDKPLSYDLHIPMVVDKTSMLAAITVLRSQKLNEAFKRTVCGNLMDRETESRDDVKVSGEVAPPDDADWISTWNGSPCAWLQTRFPISSRYEKERP